MSTRKRDFIKSASLAATLMAATGLPSLAQDKEPIRVGIPTALTGPYGDLGEQVRRAVQFAVDEANAGGGVDGRRVEVQFLDTQAKPELARQQAEKLALSGYNLLLATIASGEGLAIGPMLERWDALYISTINKADSLTGAECSPRMFRVNRPDYSDAAAVATWLREQPEGKWAVLGADTAWGRNSGGSFNVSATGLGKSIVSEGYVAMGANDFAPYIQQIANSGAEGLWVAVGGRDGVNFAQQASQFGLLDKLKVAGVSFVTDTSAATLGDISEGIWAIVNYSATLDMPENKAFVTAWGETYPGSLPSNFEGETYLGMQVLFQAVEQAGSVAPADVAATMPGMTFDTIVGPLTMRAEDHQMVGPNYFGRVEMYEGKLRPVISLTVPAEAATPAPDGSCRM